MEPQRESIQNNELPKGIERRRSARYLTSTLMVRTMPGIDMGEVVDFGYHGLLVRGLSTRQAIQRIELFDHEGTLVIDCEVVRHVGAFTAFEFGAMETEQRTFLERRVRTELIRALDPSICVYDPMLHLRSPQQQDARVRIVHTTLDLIEALEDTVRPVGQIALPRKPRSRCVDLQGYVRRQHPQVKVLLWDEQDERDILERIQNLLQRPTSGVMFSID